ncbi:MAG: VIT domain-containing protein, partial [Planctomycetota bacterium]
MPQSRGFSLRRDTVGNQPHRSIEVTAVRAHVRIVDRTASTTLEVDLSNPAGRAAEAVLLLPLPEGGVVSH